MTAVSVIVPVRNGARTLARCLTSVRAAAAGKTIELLVADNGSTDGSPAVARAHGATVLSLPDEKVSAVRNRAAQAARAPLLAFIDADHMVGPGWFDAALGAVEDAAIGAVGAEYHPPSPGTWVQRTYDLLRPHDGGRRSVAWLPSGNLLVTRSAFEAVGGFDERLDTCEDVDFCRRITSAGYALVCDPRLLSVHLGDPATLGAVFLGEMWRGRDNLRVSLRRPLALRSVLSALQPLAIAAVLGAATVGVALHPSEAAWYLAGGLGLTILASLPRAAQMAARADRSGPGVPIRCMAVALAFDLGRAAALVLRAGHGVRRHRESPFVPEPRP